METVLFAILALASILSALLVVTSPSPIASAMYLVVTFVSLAGLYVLLSAPFVAAIQVIVYAGAILVLMLFVIMLLNLKRIEEKISPVWKALGIFTATITLIAAFFSVIRTPLNSRPDITSEYGKVASIGNLLFTKYLYAFEVVSIILLLAVIGAVALVRKGEGEGDTRAN
jgi:NADH-quinone oxidoreductase subunit J